MSVREIRPFVESWCEAGEPFAVALLTETWASAPRRPGARFAVSAGGAIAGNVSAGCVEADLALRLEQLLSGGSPAFVEYGVSDETAAGVGLSCGGRLRLFLRPAACDDPIWAHLLSRLDSRAATVLITALDPDSDQRWLLGESGSLLESTASDPAPPVAVEASRDLSAAGGAGVVRTDAGRELLVEVFLPPRRLVVVGGTPVGICLARLAAAVDIPVTVVEPREAYGVGIDAAGAELVREWPEEALEAVGLDASCAVAVVAHDLKLDLPSLSAALAAGCSYVGLLGGRRTREARLAALAASGVSRDRLAEIRAPIGISIGAEGPDEIAVSILAEVIAAWRGM